MAAEAGKQPNNGFHDIQAHVAVAALAMVKAAEGTRTKWLVGDYFRIFYSAPVGESRRPFSKKPRIVTKPDDPSYSTSTHRDNSSGISASNRGSRRAFILSVSLSKLQLNYRRHHR
jgi:hypothetical protein